MAAKKRSSGLRLAMMSGVATGAQGAERADEGEPVGRQRHAAGEEMRARARMAGHAETRDIESVGQGSDIAWPVHEAATGLEIRQAEARPVDRDQAEARALGRLIGEGTFEPAARRAVTIEDRKPLRVAPFGDGEAAPVGERDRVSRFVIDHVGKERHVGRPRQREERPAGMAPVRLWSE